MIIGIFGCGAIGTEICRGLSDAQIDGKLFFADRHIERAIKLAKESKLPAEFGPFHDLVNAANLVVECASPQAARDIALPVLQRGKSLMLLSAGVLVDPEFTKEVYETARQNNCTVIHPVRCHRVHRCCESSFSWRNSIYNVNYHQTAFGVCRRALCRGSQS